jgi:hypothetical protein
MLSRRLGADALALAFGLLRVACLLAVACKGEQATVSSARPQSLEDDLAAHLEAVATCSTDERGRLDMTCPSADYLDRWSRENFAAIEGNAAAFAARAAPAAGHEAAATRSVVVRFAGLGLEKGDAASGDLLLQRIAVESDPGVAHQIVNVAVKSQKRAPAARAVVVAGLAHPSVRVRETACLLIELGEDAAALDALEGLLDAKTTTPALFQVCFQSLAGAWMNRTPRSRAAYERTLKRLETGPRDVSHPVFPVVYELTTLEPGSELVDQARVDRLVRSIARDAQASPAARSAALTSLMGKNLDLLKEVGLTLDEAQAIIKAGIAETAAQTPPPAL